MKNALSAWKSNLKAMNKDESGDIVQTVIVIAIFVVAAIVVGTILFNAIKKKGTDTGNCIKSVNVTNPSGSGC